MYIYITYTLLSTYSQHVGENVGKTILLSLVGLKSSLLANTLFIFSETLVSFDN